MGDAPPDVHTLHLDPRHPAFTAALAYLQAIPGLVRLASGGGIETGEAKEKKDG